MRKSLAILIFIIVGIVTGCGMADSNLGCSVGPVFEMVPMGEWLDEDFIFDSDSIHLIEIPELGYSYGRINGDNYICYKDILIIGSNVYKKEGGIYIFDHRTLYDLLEVEEGSTLDICRQYKNLIDTKSQDGRGFLLYDMDKDIISSCAYKENGEKIMTWYIYDGSLYYRRNARNEIRRIDLSDQKEQIVYRGNKEGVNMREFLIRGDGVILCEWYGADREYWLFIMGNGTRKIY